MSRVDLCACQPGPAGLIYSPKCPYATHAIQGRINESLARAEETEWLLTPNPPDPREVVKTEPSGEVVRLTDVE
jgi:hypothetical protein